MKTFIYLGLTAVCVAGASLFFGLAVIAVHQDKPYFAGLMFALGMKLVRA